MKQKKTIRYLAPIQSKDYIVQIILKEFGARPLIGRNTVTFRGGKDSGLESIRLELKDNIIRVEVEITDDNLISFFDGILGEPYKIEN